MTDESIPSVPTSPAPPPRRRRRWGWLLLALVPLLALGVTEGLGLTAWTPVPAMIRGDGILVVEVEDPKIEVTIAGAGVVSRATGAREVGLPPGHYEIWAVHRGRTLKQEWLTLQRNETQTWQVKLPTRPAPVRPAVKPFVVLARDDAAEKQFDTLAEAIDYAMGGDIIEIHGNGPFEMDPIRINQPLAIRAADGFWPVLRLKPQATGWLLTSTAALVLEGLELDGMTVPAEEGKSRGQINPAGPFYLANCRILQRGPSNGIGSSAPIIEVANCEFDVSPWNTIAWSVPGGRFVLGNCLLSHGPISFQFRHGKEAATIRLAHTTLLRCEFRFYDKLEPGKYGPIHLELTENVFTTKQPSLLVNQSHDDVVPVEQARSIVLDLFRVKDEHSLYAPGRPLSVYAVKFKWASEGALTTLEDWQQFWKIDTPGSLQEAVKFQRNDPQELEDFRLAKDSPGKGAGKDGRDLGTDIDLVGPGPGYERWRRTAAYKEWSKKVDQVLAGEE